MADVTDIYPLGQVNLVVSDLERSRKSARAAVVARIPQPDELGQRAVT